METVLVIDGDDDRRAAVLRALASLRPGARTLTATSWGEAQGRLAQERPAGPILALTDDMSPDTLMGAEAFGVSAVLRTPPEVHQLEHTLRFIDESGDARS